MVKAGRSDVGDVLMRLTIGDGVAEKTGSGASCPLRGQTRKSGRATGEPLCPQERKWPAGPVRSEKGPKAEIEK